MLHTRARLDLKQSCQHGSTPPQTTQTVFSSELIAGCLTNLSSHGLHWSLVAPRICIPPWAGGALFKTHTLQNSCKTHRRTTTVSGHPQQPPQSSAVVTLTTCGCSLPNNWYTKKKVHISRALMGDTTVAPMHTQQRHLWCFKPQSCRAHRLSKLTAQALRQSFPTIP